MKTAGDILIVDDERDIRSLIAATLRDEGFATMEAASAGQARDRSRARARGEPEEPRELGRILFRLRVPAVQRGELRGGGETRVVSDRRVGVRRSARYR